MSLAPETRLTLGQLRTFLAVASTGSVRAAADQLVVTQPAVSSALAAVRKQVGVALVTRDGRGLRLTPAGEALAERARAALALLDEAVAAARGEADPDRGRLRLASVTTAGVPHAAPLCPAFDPGRGTVYVATDGLTARNLRVTGRRSSATTTSRTGTDCAGSLRAPVRRSSTAARSSTSPSAAAPRPGRKPSPSRRTASCS